MTHDTLAAQALMYAFLTAVCVLLAFCVVVLFRRVRFLKAETSRLRDEFGRMSDVLSQVVGRVYRIETSATEPVRAPIPTSEEHAQHTEESLPQAESLAVELPHPLPAARDDWETVVGTNWLNRAGALVLVIGIALFLGYSLTQLGPAGKVGIGFAIGLSMLAAGIAAERHDRYRSFSFGLMGGGWAVTYLTGYAMHGIEAARVIESPVAGTAILLAISGGMILHALQYKSETVTALAFLFAFASLNATPLTAFSVVATAVLAASVLYVAAAFSWKRLAVTGVLFTYMSFVLRYDPAIYSRQGILNGQATLWIYWLVFECFDLLDLRRVRTTEIVRPLFFLNACGFIGASLLHEWNMKAADWSWFFGISSMAYLASSFVRARLVPRVASDDDAERTWRRGYEGSAAASAGLMAAALIERFSGTNLALALLMEGELVVLAGFALRNRLLHRIGGVVLALAFCRLFFEAVSTSRRITVAGVSLQSWTPLALLMAAVFVANRLTRKEGPIYGAATSVLLAAVIEAEFDRYRASAAWAVLTVAALAVGIHRNLIDLRIQAYFGVLATFIRAAAVNVAAADTVAATTPAAVVVALFYAGQALLAGAAYGQLEGKAKICLSLAATGLLTILLFDAVEGGLLTVALGFEAAVLLAAGFAARERVLRLSGLVIFLLCIGKLFAYDLRELDTLSRILSFVVLGVMLLAASWVYTRFREKIRKML
jgi:hypothetical protein